MKVPETIQNDAMFNFLLSQNKNINVLIDYYHTGIHTFEQFKEKLMVISKKTKDYLSTPSKIHIEKYKIVKKYVDSIEPISIGKTHNISLENVKSIELGVINFIENTEKSKNQTVI